MGSNVSRKKIRQKVLEIREENGTAKVKRMKKKNGRNIQNNESS